MDKYKELCKKAISNRNIDSGASMHTSGAKPHFSTWEEMTDENGGVAPSMDDFFMRTHKIQKNDGEWIFLQSQQIFDNFSKLKEEILSNGMNETEGTSQDDVTQPNHKLSDLAIFAQSVGGKKKSRIAGIRSLGRALDDHFSTSTQATRVRSDDPLIASMKNRMKELEQENQQLKQELSENRQRLSENNAKLKKILQHINLTVS